MSVIAKPDWRNDGNEGIVLQRLDDRRIDRIDLANKADIEKLTWIFLVRHLHLARTDQTAILAGQADRLTAVVVNQHHDILLHFAAQHPLHHFHRFFIGDAHALDKGALLADLLQCVVDLRAAAMYNDRIHADQFQQDHVAREAVLQMFFGHGIAAVFDDNRLAVKFADVRQRFGQDLSLDLRRNFRQVSAERGRIGHD